jgi:hypothetical protein
MGNVDELIANLAQDNAKVKQAPHPYVMSIEWMTFAAFYLVLTLMFSGARHDLLLKLHEPWFAVEIATLLCIIISTSLSAALLSYPDLHQMRKRTFVPISIFVFFGLIMFLAYRVDNPPAPLPVHSFECTTSITVFSLLPAGWGFFVMRKFASTHIHWAGGNAFLFAFSVGALRLRLHEQNDSIIHVIQWHYMPMFLIFLLGLWVGKVALKW